MDRKLRKLAEQRIAVTPPHPPAQPDDVIHELQVHQVELEIQNEELRRSQGELQRIRDEYAALYDDAPVGYITLGAEGQILRYNRTFLRLLGRDSLPGSPPFLVNFLGNDGKKTFNSRFRRFYEDSTGQSMEVDLPDGRIIKLQGAPGGLLALVDVTSERRAEQRVRVLLEEKELLLREVHHRVKNNLSTVASQLSLQASRLTEEHPVAADAVRRAQERVLAMQSVYEVLNQNEVYRTIDAARYLEDLLDRLQKTTPTSADIRFVRDIESVQLQTKTTVTLGLLVNELISNAWKHAFSQGPVDPVITISLRRNPEGSLGLVVADNGAGPPSDGTPGSGSLGLLMVHLLAEQLQGTISFGCTSESGRGTCVRLTFRDAPQL